MTAPALNSAESWDDFQRTLSSKVVEALEIALHDNTGGRMSDETLVAVANALFSTVVGLVPMDIADAIYAVRKAKEK